MRSTSPRPEGARLDRYSNDCYRWRMQTELTFGERVRRLRRDKQWSLHSLAERTGLSYSHLSRVENDSVPPGVETVTKLADVLDADLGELLQLADCLPRQILDRILAREDQRATTDSLKRRAGSAIADDEERGDPLTGLIAALVAYRGVARDDAMQIAATVDTLLALPPDQRSAIVALVLSMGENRAT